MKRKLKTLWSPNAAEPGKRGVTPACPNPPRRACGLPVVRKSAKKTYLKGWVV